MKRYFFLLLIFLILAPATAQDEAPLPVLHAENIFAEGVTVLEESNADNIPSPNPLFTQDGSWRVQNTNNESYLCQINSYDCRLLPRHTESTSILEPCETYWNEDGLIGESPNREWVIFTACAGRSEYDLYSYNLGTNEIILLNSEFYGGLYYYIYMLDWLNDFTPVLQIGGTRTGSLHSLATVDVRYTDSLNGIANQFAYAPYYSATLKTVYNSDQYFYSDGFSVIGWKILEHNLLTDEIVTVAEYTYEEPRAGDATVGHVIKANEDWVVVGDSYPLGYETPVHFYDRHTHELRFSYFSLPTTVDSWVITMQKAGLWLWEYDLDSEETNYLLKRIWIESQEIEEIVVAESGEWVWRQIYISDDENFLVLLQHNQMGIYDINADTFISLTQGHVELCDGCQFEVEWQPDNTLMVDLIVNYKVFIRWHIRIDALNEEQS